MNVEVNMSVKQLYPHSKDFFKIKPDFFFFFLQKAEGRRVRDQTDYRMNMKMVTAKAAQFNPCLNA